MRRVLLASLPLTTILVIVASFFLLTKQHLAQQSLHNAAFTIQKPTPLTPALPSVKTTPIINHITPTPTLAKVTATPSATITQAQSKVVVSPTKVPTPTQTRLTITPTSVITHTSIPTPTPIKSASTKQSSPAVQALVTQAESGDTIKIYLLQKINEYRFSLELNAVSSDTNTCNFAKTRATEIKTDFTHDGFTNRIKSHILPYDSYHEVAENIAMNADYRQIVAMWINSPLHAENMRRDTPYVCVQKDGDFYAYEGWKP